MVLKFYAYHARIDRKGKETPIKKTSTDQGDHTKENKVYIRPLEVDSIDWVQFGALTPSGVFKNDD